MATDEFEEDVLARCLDQADPEQALTEACASHPGHAASLRRRYGKLMALGFFASTAPAPGTPQAIGGCRLTRPLGQGGMGLVYAAVDEGTGTEVAIKLIQPEQAWLPMRRERFRREAALLARLRHPGIVQVRSFGEHGGTPWLAMEMVPGRTLAGVIEQVQGRDPATLSGRDLRALLDPAAEGEGAPMFAGSWTVAAAHIARDLALALDHAHQEGILHRDVKPSNVLVTGTGRVVVIDFGLARDVDATAITTTGANPGSLPYMPPEALVGSEPGMAPRVDVYGVGAVLYELLTLRPPFTATTAEALRASIIAGEVKAPRTSNASIPRDLETVCLRAMATEPQLRYADMRSLAADLDHLLAMRPIAMRPIPRWRRLWRRAKQRPLLAAVVMGALLALPIAGVAIGHALAHAGELRAGAALLRQQQYEELVATGFLHLEQSNRRLALQAFAEAEPLADGDLFALVGTMMTLLSFGEPGEVLAIAAKLPPASRQVLLPYETSALHKLGRSAEAEQLSLRQPTATGPTELFQHGRSMLQNNEATGDPEVFRQADELISRAVALATRPWLHFWCERVHAAGHTRDLRALREGSEVLERQWPESAIAWFWIGYARQRFDVEAALAAYRRSLQLAPKLLYSRRNLAQLLVAQRQFEGAKSEADQMVAIAPDDVRTWLVVGYTSDHAYDRTRAHEAYRKAAEIAPDNWDAVLNLGVFEWKADHDDEAERLFQRAIAHKPGCAPAYACLASMHMEKGQDEAALAMARKATAIDPRLVWAQQVLAEVLVKGGEASGARAALQAAVSLDPRSEQTHAVVKRILKLLEDEAGIEAENQRFQALRDGSHGR